MISYYLYPAIAVFLYMTLLFLIAVLKKDNGIVDIGWGLGFVLVAALTFAQSSFHMRQLLITAMTALWGLRLSMHIFFRNWGKGEDFRYKKWREEWKFFYLRSYFQVFMLQGFLMLVIATPIILVNSASGPGLNFLDAAGVIVFLIGFLFEAVGDLQLFMFVKKQKGVMTEGLWKYTRHPNYFGEALLWWGFFLMALNVSWFAVISPLVIGFLILKVSGIPMLEKKYEGNKEYEEYKKRTNAFFPWFPKD